MTKSAGELFVIIVNGWKLLMEKFIFCAVKGSMVVTNFKSKFMKDKAKLTEALIFQRKMSYV